MIRGRRRIITPIFRITSRIADKILAQFVFVSASALDVCFFVVFETNGPVKAKTYYNSLICYLVLHKFVIFLVGKS